MKWIAAAVIALSFSAVGLLEAGRLALREKRCAEAVSLLSFLENELSLGAGELRALFSGSAFEARWIAGYCAALQKGAGAAAAFESCAGAFGDFPEREILSELFGSFGALPLSRQLEELARAKTRLARAGEAAGAEREKRSRLKLVLWSSAGCTLSLLLV